MRVESELTDYVTIKKGVRKGCVMSLAFFSLYAEIIISKFADMEGISNGGQNVNNIMYAHDPMLIADSNKNFRG